MKMDIKTVAKSARIFLKEEELPIYGEKLDCVLKWFEEMLIGEIPNTINPVYSTVSEEAERNYFFDEVFKPENSIEVLKNVPNKKESLIIVPKVI